MSVFVRSLSPLVLSTLIPLRKGDVTQETASVCPHTSKGPDLSRWKTQHILKRSPLTWQQIQLQAFLHLPV